MKRFWLSIAFVPFIVLCIGTFYIQAAARHLPDFTLEKQEGDEKESAGLFLRGRFGQNETVSIGGQGSEYLSEKSFFERMGPSYWGREELEQLAKEHRQFMRAKQAPDSFYEDDTLLAYVNAKSDFSSSGRGNNLRFTVSLLNKKQNNSSSYEVSVPNENLYNQVIVQDVQLIGKELKVFTQNYNRNGSRSEIHLYTLALTNNQMPIDQIIFPQLPESAGMRTNIRKVHEIDSTRSNRYIVYQAVQSRTVENGHNAYIAENVGGQLLAYDIQAGKELEIESEEVNDLLQERMDSAVFNVYAEGDYLILTKQDKEGIRVVQYSIPDGKVKSHDFRTDSAISSTIKNHRVYMLIKNKDRQEPPSLTVADLNKGEIVYKGMITLKGTDQDESHEFSKLSIYQVVVK